MLGFVFFLFSLGYGTCSVPNVSCTIMNFEYIDCTWNESGVPEFNYTFYRLMNKTGYKCPTYLQEGAHIMGCRLPYEKSDKFEQLVSYLSLDNNSSRKEQKIYLKDRVKLMPPHNLTLQMQGSSELWLYWNISARSTCVESEVSYRKDTDTENNTSGVLLSKYYPIPFPSENSRYTFQVRTRVMEACFQSNWSAWSRPAYWRQKKLGNSTSTEAYHGRSIDWLTFMIAVMSCVVVVAVIVLAFQNERLRVILIPILPNPSKTLDELLYTYNGNVEEWLHISKDFVEGFKPNFSEPACPVREYNLIPQISNTGSASSLPILLDESDCLYTSCSTSTSSIPSPPGDTSPGQV